MNEPLTKNENINYTLIINEMQKAKYHIELITAKYNLELKIQQMQNEYRNLERKYDELVVSHNTMHHLNNKIKAEMEVLRIQQETLIVELQTQLAKRSKENETNSNTDIN